MLGALKDLPFRNMEFDSETETSSPQAETNVKQLKTCHPVQSGAGGKGKQAGRSSISHRFDEMTGRSRHGRLPSLDQC